MAAAGATACAWRRAGTSPTARQARVAAAPPHRLLLSPTLNAFPHAQCSPPRSMPTSVLLCGQRLIPPRSAQWKARPALPTTYVLCPAGADALERCQHEAHALADRLDNPAFAKASGCEGLSEGLLQGRAACLERSAMQPLFYGVYALPLAHLAAPREASGHQPFLTSPQGGGTHAAPALAPFARPFPLPVCPSASPHAAATNSRPFARGHTRTTQVLGPSMVSGGFWCSAPRGLKQ